MRSEAEDWAVGLVGLPMKERWGELLQADPYYNRNFTLTDVPFTFAYPPR